MQHIAFNAVDDAGNQIEVTCTRGRVQHTNHWGKWECFTPNGDVVTPIDLDKGEFQIMDLAKTLITSLEPNPLQ
jgi:hypothetical protein